MDHFPFQLQPFQPREIFSSLQITLLMNYWQIKPLYMGTFSHLSPKNNHSSPRSHLKISNLNSCFNPWLNQFQLKNLSPILYLFPSLAITSPVTCFRFSTYFSLTLTILTKKAVFSGFWTVDLHSVFSPQCESILFLHQFNFIAQNLC